GTLVVTIYGSLGIPEGPIDQGPASGRIRALEEQLVKAKEQIENYKKQTRNAKKLVCNINKGCGYGCQLHHVVYCFMIAYGTQRTLILESHNWRYATGGWETVFRPVSETCTDRSGVSTGHWSVSLRQGLKFVFLTKFPGSGTTL
ncbi:hypothetical protein FD754_018000, partial [Muntiacus muntjak]